MRSCKLLVLGASPMALMAGIAAADGDGSNAADNATTRPTVAPATMAASHPAVPSVAQSGRRAAPPGAPRAAGGAGRRG